MSWLQRLFGRSSRGGDGGDPITPPAPIDILRLVPRLAAHHGTAVRLHPMLALRPLPAQVSKLGGVFLANGPDQWPRCPEHGDHLPILQLRRDDVPELPFPDGAVVFQLTWCGGPHDQGWYACVVRWLRPEEAVPVGKANPRDRTDPAHADAGQDAVRECALHPERIREHPAADDLPPDLADEILARPELPALGHELFPEDAEDLEAEDDCAPRDLAWTVYNRLLASAPGSKVGGHPHWDAEPGWPSCCARRMSFMLSIAHEWDGQTMMRWLPVIAHRPFPPPRYGRHGYPHTVHLFGCRTCGRYEHVWRK